MSKKTKSSLLLAQHSTGHLLAGLLAGGGVHEEILEVLSMAYQKLEYCDWKDTDTEETVKWELHDVTQEIINDIEGAVLQRIQTDKS